MKGLMVSKVYEVSNKKMEIFFIKLFTGPDLFRLIRKPLMRPIDFGHPAVRDSNPSFIGRDADSIFRASLRWFQVAGIHAIC
jgi:hypothetical protein